MRDDRITEGQVPALLDGLAPESRHDLQEVAALVGALRLAAFEPPPQPSPALAARLDLDRLAWVSAARSTGMSGSGAEQTSVLAQRPARSKVKSALGWFTGLGIAAQLALGAGAVSASAAGMGIAGALPPAAQELFDTVVATAAHADELFAGQGNAEPVAPELDAHDARAGVDDIGGDGPTTGDAAAGSAAEKPDGSASSDGTGATRDAVEPVQAEKPDKAGRPGKAGKPEDAESRESSEPAETAGKAERSNKSDKSDNPVKAEKREPADSAEPAETESASGSDDAADGVTGQAPNSGKNRDMTGSIGSGLRGGTAVADAHADKPGKIRPVEV